MRSILLFSIAGSWNPTSKLDLMVTGIKSVYSSVSTTSIVALAFSPASINVDYLVVSWPPKSSTHERPEAN